jgi:hypothetical protein
VFARRAQLSVFRRQEIGVVGEVVLDLVDWEICALDVLERAEESRDPLAASRGSQGAHRRRGLLFQANRILRSNGPILRL